MSVQDELEAIRAKCRGILQPERVVAYAKNPKTALHKRFTWDDGRAAHQYRLWQARELIQCHVTVLEGTSESFRTYISMRADRKTAGGGYRMIVDVMSDAGMRKRLLAEALDDAHHWQEKYRLLKELQPIFQELARLRRKTKAKVA